MVLDTATLRIAFALMAMVLGLLFYFAAYRSTRSPYSAVVVPRPDALPRRVRCLSLQRDSASGGGPTRWETAC